MDIKLFSPYKSRLIASLKVSMFITNLSPYLNNQQMWGTSLSDFLTQYPQIINIDIQVHEINIHFHHININMISIVGWVLIGRVQV